MTDRYRGYHLSLPRRRINVIHGLGIVHVFVSSLNVFLRRLTII